MIMMMTFYEHKKETALGLDKMKKTELRLLVPGIELQKTRKLEDENLRFESQIPVP